MGRRFGLLKVHLSSGGRAKCGTVVTVASLTDELERVTCRACVAKGPLTSNWKGNEVGIRSGRDRCRALYPSPLGTCEGDGCEREAVDRHHVDGDTRNNDRSNVAFLCRRCHQKIDGRSAKRVAEMLATTPSMTIGKMSEETKARMSEAKRSAWRTGVYDRRLAARGADGKWSAIQ